MRSYGITLATVLLVASCSSEQGERTEIVNTKDPHVGLRLDYRSDGTLETVGLITADSGLMAKFDLNREYGLFGLRVTRDLSLENAVEFFENGRPAGLRNVDARGTGHTVYYHENGAIRSEGWLVREKRFGIWRDFDSTGVLIKVDTLGSLDTLHLGYPLP